MKLYFKPSPLLDVGVLGAAIGYLGLLYVGVRAYYRGIGDVMHMFGVGGRENGRKL